MTVIWRWLWVVLSLLFLGCSAYRPVNSQLGQVNLTQGYRPARLPQEQASEEVLILLAFSGGGTRAAALSYGVLEELRDTPIRGGGTEGRLLDEVDLISSVSGGSFTAAYYGLFGDQIFTDFEERFLKRNVQRRLILQLLRPINSLTGKPLV